MICKLLTVHHLEFLSLKGGCTGMFESTHIKMPHCWKSHALALFTVYVSYTAGTWWNKRGHSTQQNNEGGKGDCTNIQMGEI